MSTQALDTAAPARRWRDGAEGYGRLSRLNHWALAVLMIAMLLSGLALEYAPLAQGAAGVLRDGHKAAGVVVLALGLWRVGWRLAQGFPREAATLPAWQARAARATHWALLAAILLMPLSGMLMTLLAGRPIALGPLTIPGGAEVAWLASLAGEAHAAGGLALAGFVALHVAAALRHHLIGRDGTLGRMALRPPSRPAPRDAGRP